MSFPIYVASEPDRAQKTPARNKSRELRRR